MQPEGRRRPVDKPDATGAAAAAVGDEAATLSRCCTPFWRPAHQSLSPAGSGHSLTSAAGGGNGGTAHAAKVGRRFLAAADVVGRDAILKSLHSLHAFCVAHVVVCSCPVVNVIFQYLLNATDKKVLWRRF